ncbi:MAG: energy transducer TonB, partial [Chitinophagia bacterium]|nr:energy transducer TonB [Chitinophagia bacterium]
DINNILSADYLDIIFNGRNKKYGGYELRKNYPKRVRNATIAGLVGIIMLFAGPMIASILAKNEGNKKKMVAAPVKPTVKFTPPKITEDEKVKEEEKPAEVKELKETTAGAKTQEGDPNALEPAIVDNKNTGVVAAPAAPQIYQFVEQMPASGYDINAFLEKELHYPDNAKEAGVQGRVIINFVVNEDGSISDVKVVRGIGGGCDEEAKRVVSMMPHWKPGKQNGKPVKCYFTQPISFKLE